MAAHERHAFSSDSFFVRPGVVSSSRPASFSGAPARYFVAVHESIGARRHLEDGGWPPPATPQHGGSLRRATPTAPRGRPPPPPVTAIFIVIAPPSENPGGPDTGEARAIRPLIKNTASPQNVEHSGTSRRALKAYMHDGTRVIQVSRPLGR